MPKVRTSKILVLVPRKGPLAKFEAAVAGAVPYAHTISGGNIMLGSPQLFTNVSSRVIAFNRRAKSFKDIQARIITPLEKALGIKLKRTATNSRYSRGTEWAEDVKGPKGAVYSSLAY